MGSRSVAITLSAEPFGQNGDGKTTPCVAAAALSRSAQPPSWVITMTWNR
jgi:hypothetical protein